MSYCKCNICQHLWDLEFQPIGKIRCPNCGKSDFLSLSEDIEDLIKAEIEELEKNQGLGNLHSE